MATNTALKRTTKTDREVVQIDADVAKTIATSWQSINAAEEALMRLDTGIVQWQVAPAAQTAMASMIADELKSGDKIMTLGFQAYPYMRAAGASVASILETQLGKTLPQNVVAATADDIIAAIKSGTRMIVAVHAETKTDWADVRAISAAAVKSETPMLMVISAAVEGAAVETQQSWGATVRELREAVVSVRNQKAIRVVAMSDMSVAEIEQDMIEAAKIPAAEWQNILQKNADGAEIAVNAAYQAPVKSF
ncbi:MAG: hypothetical protein KGQ41_05230 [Alphaproteobacteria bacterium]|nr:hypothetical protein [Alphaproteobacteria bacterium]